MNVLQHILPLFINHNFPPSKLQDLLFLYETRSNSVQRIDYSLLQSNPSSTFDLSKNHSKFLPYRGRHLEIQGNSVAELDSAVANLSRYHSKSTKKSASMKSAENKQSQPRLIKEKTAQQKQIEIVKASLAKLMAERKALSQKNPDSAVILTTGHDIVELLQTEIEDSTPTQDQSVNGLERDVVSDEKDFISDETEIAPVPQPELIPQQGQSTCWAENFLRKVGKISAAAEISRIGVHIDETPVKSRLVNGQAIGKTNKISSSESSVTKMILGPIDINKSTLSTSQVELIPRQSSTPGEDDVAIKFKFESTRHDRNIKQKENILKTNAGPVGMSERSNSGNHGRQNRRYGMNLGFVRAQDHPEEVKFKREIPIVQKIEIEPSNEAPSNPAPTITSSTNKHDSIPLSREKMTQALRSGSESEEEITHTPIGLVKHLRSAGIIRSNERSFFKSTKGSDPVYVYEKYLLDNLQYSSPYDIFCQAVRDIKIGSRSHNLSEDPAIIPGARFNYDLPSWVSNQHGRLYVWQCARNLRLGHPSITKSEYENVVNKFGRECKTYQEIDADEAFERGEWDVVIELRKPENRDAILEYERQIQASLPIETGTTFNYEDYEVPKSFKLRMIKCPPRVTLEHETSTYRKVEDLPPQDKIRLDIDCFTKDDQWIEVNVYDTIEGKYPEVQIPLFSLSGIKIDGKLPRSEKSSGRSTHSGQQREEPVLLLSAPPLYWAERDHDDLRWTNKIQRPRTKADLNAHGCFLYMNPKNVKGLSNWLDGVVDLALKKPCRVDVNTMEFRTGIYPTTGLAKPYFPYPHELFQDVESFYATPQQAPDLDIVVYEEDKGFDPIQSHDEQMPWNVQHSTETICRLYLNFLSQQYKLRQRQTRVKRSTKEQAMEEALAYEPVQAKKITLNPFEPNPNSTITTDIHMYVRPAIESDCNGFLSIYNHWHSTTSSLPDKTIREEDFFTKILSTTTSSNLPFYVACASSNSSLPTASSRGTRSLASHSERIIGISFALPYHPCSSLLSPSAFKTTYNLHIYSSASSTHRQKGISNTLLDRLLAAFDNTYRAQYPTKCHIAGQAKNNFLPGGLPGIPPAHKLLADIYYTDNNVGEMLWKRDWLGKRGWKQNALMSGLGRVDNGREGLHVCVMGWDVGYEGRRPKNQTQGEGWCDWGTT